MSPAVRLIVATLVAPAVGVLCLVAPFLATGRWVPGRHGLVDALVLLVVVALLAHAYPLMLLVGIPFHVTMRRLGRREWWLYAAAGAATGLGGALISAAVGGRRPPLADVVWAAALGGALPGLLAALTAWAIVHCGASAAPRSGVHHA